jgi:hypothetical protein
MIKFKLLRALAIPSMLSLAQPPAFGREGREVAAPSWSAACMTDQGPSDCGESMGIHRAPEQYTPRRHSSFEINQSADKR